MKVIVYTRHGDAGVSICTPTPEIIAAMAHGSYFGKRPRGFLDEQVERNIANGIRSDVARRFVHALEFGGCTTAEALEIIRDRDCGPHGTAIELWDAADVPADRWFRNAWRRSANGGPISVDLRKARPIQLAHIKSALAIETKRRDSDDDLWSAPLVVDLAPLVEKIKGAQDADALRAIWPSELRVA
ncbi:hypothetical protein X566_00775 [Afipia sp. P52-10]|nr:hypothetical protein X566_17915 [Afipia sp. P52-10]ETR79178.1 hypothetical protein X566_00775 [Afipia sp. P52-10]